MHEEGTVVGRNTWPKDLRLDITAADLESIPLPDREAFFDGMLKFLAHQSDVEIFESGDDVQLVTGASAQLMIPGTRVFIRFGDASRDWYKKLIRIVAMVAIVGNISPLSAFVGLTLDLTFAIFEKLSRLDEVDTEIVNAILQLSKNKTGDFPSTSDIAGAAQGASSDLKTRLASLKSLGIVREEPRGWQVVF